MSESHSPLLCEKCNKVLKNNALKVRNQIFCSIECAGLEKCAGCKNHFPLNSLFDFEGKRYCTIECAKVICCFRCDDLCHTSKALNKYYCSKECEEKENPLVSCHSCNKPFRKDSSIYIDNNGYYYCSNQCAGISNCKECGKPFFKKKSKYPNICSDTCYHSYRRRFHNSQKSISNVINFPEKRNRASQLNFEAVNRTPIPVLEKKKSELHTPKFSSALDATRFESIISRLRLIDRKYIKALGFIEVDTNALFVKKVKANIYLYVGPTFCNIEIKNPEGVNKIINVYNLSNGDSIDTAKKQVAKYKVPNMALFLALMDLRKNISSYYSY